MTEGTEVRETSRWATPVLLAIFGYYMFMWWIPAIGHRILLADDYYGMARSPYFDIEKANCDHYDYQRVEGNFLFIYPYEAIIS